MEWTELDFGRWLLERTGRYSDLLPAVLGASGALVPCDFGAFGARLVISGASVASGVWWPEASLIW